MTSQPTGRDESAIARRVGVDPGVPRPLGDPRAPRRRPGRTARSKRDVPIRLALWRMAVAHAAPLGRPFTERAGETAASALGDRRGGRYMARSGSRFGAAAPGASRVASESPRTRPARGSHPRGRGGGMTKPGFRAPQAHLDDRDETRRRRATLPRLATLLACNARASVGRQAPALPWTSVGEASTGGGGRGVSSPPARRNARQAQSSDVGAAGSSSRAIIVASTVAT